MLFKISNTIFVGLEHKSSRRALRQKYSARGPLVLKESEDTPVRLDLNVITYLNIQ